MHLGGQDVLFSEGSPGDGLFLIVSGRLQAIQTSAGGEERILREMGPGEVLGEIALITGENRTATVPAIATPRWPNCPRRRSICWQGATRHSCCIWRE